MTKSYRKDYPRPQLVRESWVNLNGSWDFLFDDENAGETGRWYEAFPADHRSICVPYTYETKMSGIGETDHHENVWYHRQVTVSAKDLAGRVLLHFEGSDFETKVWVNGSYAGSHRGGYARFSFDVTAFLKEGANEITVKAEDSMSIEQPRGKQRWAKDNFGCWYVQTTGIWKTVWMEAVPAVHLERMKIVPILKAGKVALEYHVAGDFSADDLWVEAVVEFGGTRIARSSAAVTRSRVKDTISVYLPEEMPWGIHPWAPQHPDLYDLTVRVRKGNEILDEVFSYFGMREIRIEEGNILLNGVPLYERLILDQGYWKDSHLTPPDEQALIDDIDKIQAMGFNGLRKHMKIEDERFLYWCDVKGMLVWSEMAAAYEYSDDAVEEFTREWMEVVRQNLNHPCIITWTPFNESWGVPKIKTVERQQEFTEAIYYLTRSIDSTRPIITNDGWEHTISDILTFHDYEERGEVFFDRYADHLEEIGDCQIYHSNDRSAFAEGYAYSGEPVIISEYGGIAFAGGGEGDWGYGNTVKDEEEFLERFDAIKTAIKNLPYCSGFCYTQVSDVQQEINGLLDADHNYKIAPEKIKEIICRQVGIRRINER